MSEKKLKKPEQTRCVECGGIIYKFPKREGLYCNRYCCACCPDKLAGPCQKERKFGTPTEILAKWQIGGKTNAE